MPSKQATNSATRGCSETWRKHLGAECQATLGQRGARDLARMLSEALCPEVTEVRNATTHELLTSFVDGYEYHPSLGDLARFPDAFAGAYEAGKPAGDVLP